MKLQKTDLTNGNELEGAELEVIDENGDTIDKWTSAKEPHQVKGLEEGKTYVLKENNSTLWLRNYRRNKICCNIRKKIHKKN